jgi:hypothetical protein
LEMGRAAWSLERPRHALDASIVAEAELSTEETNVTCGEVES